jgi:ABC-type transport system involved in multi-copper enzyme maturation permease subunit
MSKSFVAEMDKLVRRPATWVLVTAWTLAALIFVYLDPYIKYTSPASTLSGASRQALLTGMLPEKMVTALIAGFPIFGGAIALVFGALVVGSEYHWGTLKTVLLQRPGRPGIWFGKLLALAVMQAVVVVAVFACGALTSLMVATITHSPVNWPPVGELAQGLGAAWLMLTMWAMLGALLATLLQGATLAIGLGLFYLLVELLFRSTAGRTGPLAVLAKALPGSNAGTLAGILSPGFRRTRS